jgi:hypothetical protein
MQRDNPKRSSLPRRRSLRQVPLFRLLAINLLIGVVVAIVLVGGLLLLNPGGLRHLIFTDRSPWVAVGLLLFGFVVTFGSAAMGSAIMAAGMPREDDDRGGGLGKMVRQKVSTGH